MLYQRAFRRIFLPFRNESVSTSDIISGSTVCSLPISFDKNSVELFR